MDRFLRMCILEIEPGAITGLYGRFEWFDFFHFVGEMAISLDVELIEIFLFPGEILAVDCYFGVKLSAFRSIIMHMYKLYF